MDITLTRIETLVEETGATTRELAEAVGCSKSAIQRYLTGQREIPTSVVNGLANAFGVHPAYLFGWVDDRHFDIEEKKPVTLESNEHSANKRALMQLIQNCSDEDAARLLQIVQLFLDNARRDN